MPLRHFYYGIYEKLLQISSDVNKDDIYKSVAIAYLSTSNQKEIDELKSNVFYFIKNLDDNSVEASKFYILILGYLQDMVQSIEFITSNSHSHVNNNHKKLKFNKLMIAKLRSRYIFRNLVAFKT